MPFSHSFLLDARRWVLLSSNNFPSTTDSTWESICNRINYWVFGSDIWPVFIDFELLIETRILMEHRFLVSNSVLVLDFVVEISIPIGSSSFLILDPMVKISILVGFSPFSIGVGVFLILVPTTESWFLILSCGFWISIPSTKNEFFFPIPYAFSKVIAWNPILVLPMTLPLSTIDSNPLETIMS